MSIRWQKIIRDFWLERTRTIFVVLAIALGIAAFSAVMSSYAILTRELDEGYLATNPASFTVATDEPIDDALLKTIAAHSGVREVEARRIVTGRIKAGPVNWRSLVLFVVKDYGDIRVSTLKPQAGVWPPATGEILIERDAMQVAKAKIGDTVTVRTSNGQDQSLRVSGTVKDVGQAQARMENIVYGYITLGTLTELGEEPFLDRLNILVTGDQFNEAHIRKVAADVRQKIETLGHAIRKIDIPAPGKHPHSELMGLLLLAMAGFGLFALLLSGIIVVNLLTALMAAQIRQIGVMKTIGATRWQIACIYFCQALLLGIAAILVAVPLGMLGSRALCRYMAFFLNFDINSFAVPLWVYLLDVVVGILVPLAAAAYPVWKGSGISVREALADFGVGQTAFGNTRLDRALAGIGGTTRPLLLAIRNSFRRRARLALTLLTLAAGGLFFMAALSVRSSLIYSLDRLFAARKFDLSLNLGTMQPFEKVQRAASKTPGVVHTEGWIVTQASFVAESDLSTNSSSGHTGAGGMHGAAAPPGNSFGVIGLPPDTVLLAPDIVEGRALQPGETDTIVLNSTLASRNPQLKVGGAVNLQMGPAQKNWRIVGIAQEWLSPPTAYVSRQYFEQAGGHTGMANSVRLSLESSDPNVINAVRASLDQNLEQEGLRAQSSSTKADSRYGFDQHMLMIYIFLIVMSAILAGVGGLGLMTTMSLNVLERRREMGVLRAIGASPKLIWLIVVAEGAVIGLFSWALAAVAAWPVSNAIGNLLVRMAFKSGLNFLFEFRGVLIWLAVSIGLCVVASFLPAWNASRSSVREAIGYE